MRAVFGLLLVMLGLAMAVVWMPERDGQRQLAAVTDIAVQGLPRIADLPTANGRTFSPQTPLLASVEPQGSRPAHTVSVARVASPVVETAVQTSSPSVVTGSITAAPVAPSIAQARPQQPDMPRDELVRNLQRELRRVGCYAGEIDGDWGSGSKRAMSNFTDRVNASLPVEQPDFILLTLLRGQPAGTCAKGCPAGQAVADNGRCMPAGVVAHQARRRGRDDVAGSQGEQSGWTTQVARAQPTQARDQLEVAATATGNASANILVPAPLPGRMGVGAPPPVAAAPLTSESGARDAVRSAQADGQDVRTKRERARRTAKRSGPRYDGGFYAYRAPPPNYYASAPRRTSRSWTATFFTGGF